MSVSLKGQVALVVGASSGIGHASAVLLGQEGMKMMVSARRKERLEQLQTKLTGSGVECDIFPADAARPEDMQALADATVKRFGKVDLLVYATGTNTKDRYLPKLTVDLWHELLQANLNGGYYITRALLPAMREAKSGHLIFVSSISGKIPDVSGAAYQASKRGMVGFAHALRVEEKENGIRTCVVCPGLVDSELMEKRPVKPTRETLDKALQPEDVAEVIVAIAKTHPRVAVPEIDVMPTVL